MRLFDEEGIPTKKFILSIIFVILWLILFFGSCFTVSQWYVAVTKTFSKMNDKVYQPWLHFKTPIIDSVEKFNIQTNKDQAIAAASSKDLQNVSTEVAVNYNIDQTRVKDIYTSLGNMNAVQEKVVTPSIQEVVKAVTSKYSAEELVTKRWQVSIDITEWLKVKLWNYGVNVIDVNIINFEMSEWFNASIEAKVKAEQDALAQKNVLERVKYEQQQKVITADADLQAQKLSAEWVVVAAKAEAEAIRLKSSAVVNQWGKEYVQLKWIEKWKWEIPQYQLGWATPLIQLPN